MVKSDTILWIAAIAGGGYLLYKSGILDIAKGVGVATSGVVDVASGASNLIGSTGGAIADLGAAYAAGFNQAAALIKNPTGTQALSSGLDYSNPYTTLGGLASWNSGLNVGYDIGNALVNYTKNLYSSTFSSAKTGSTTASTSALTSAQSMDILRQQFLYTASILPSTTSSTQGTPAAEAKQTTSSGSSTGGGSGSRITTSPQGTYNPTTGVYIAPTGAGYSTRYPPKGATTIFK